MAVPLFLNSLESRRVLSKTDIYSEQALFLKKISLHIADSSLHSPTLFRIGSVMGSGIY